MDLSSDGNRSFMDLLHSSMESRSFPTVSLKCSTAVFIFPFLSSVSLSIMSLILSDSMKMLFRLSDMVRIFTT